MTKFVRFDAGQGAKYGVLEGEKIFPVKGFIFEPGRKKVRASSFRR